MTKMVLVIIYNHNYELNIERIEELYAKRFHKIYHLMPFYTGNKENVIKIYGTSYLFQDYIRQGLSFFENDDATHYCFMADDIFLGPHFNQHNILDKLSLEVDCACISDIQPLSYDMFMSWPWAAASYRSLLDNISCEYEKFLPQLNEARACFAKHNIEATNITKEGFSYLKKFLGISASNYYCTEFYPVFASQATDLIAKAKADFQTENYAYPLARGYSDFFIIPQNIIRSFAHILGVFAAMNIFVEVAIPTAMLLCADKIKTLKDINVKSFIIWDNKESYEFRRKHEASLQNLAKACTENDFIFHPVKLSKWKN